jgi:hypothetical protein
MGTYTSVYQKRAALFLLICLIFFFIFVINKRAEAQMLEEYPTRFKLTGLVDLQFINYSTKNSSGGQSFSGSTSTFEQIYELGLQGYIYHPRLAVFYSDITFDDARVLSGTKSTSRDLSYSLNVIILPYRPVSLNVYASRTHGTTDLNSFSTERTVDNYGAILNVSLTGLPALRRITVQYQHTDSTYDSRTSSTTSYSLNVNGTLRPLRTSYGILLGRIDNNSPLNSFRSNYLSLQTNTALYRGIRLGTGLRYYDDDKGNKALGINASLDFPEGRKFNHYYLYRYEKDTIHFPSYEAAGILGRTIENMNEYLEGTWSYRFTDRLSSSASVQYGTHEDELGSWDSDALSANLTYRRPIAGLSSTSQYRFSMRDNGVRGKATEHDASIELTTRRFKWGTIYLSYYFLTLNEKDNIPNITSEEQAFVGESQKFVESSIKTNAHSFVIGARGRGIGRRLLALLWDVEVDYSRATASGKRPKPSFDFDSFDFFGSQNVEFEKKNNQYSILGRINYRFGRSSTFTSQAQYSIGETDSLTRKSLILQQQLSYIMSRRLNFLGRWRERRYQIEGTPDNSARDLEFEVRYRIGKSFLTLNYLFIMDKIGSSDTRQGRLTLRIRRYL